jgi:hypothetical protein
MSGMPIILSQAAVVLEILLLDAANQLKADQPNVVLLFADDGGGATPILASRKPFDQTWLT